VVEPITATVAATNAAKNLFGSVFDRWSKAQQAHLDAAALVRLLRLEACRNRAVLEVAVGMKEPLAVSALWKVPAVLETEVMETVLGRDERAHEALAKVRELKATDTQGEDEDAGDPVDLLTRLYVRTTTLQSLSVLHRRNALTSVRIKQRLDNLRTDFVRLVRALSAAKL